MPEGESGGLVGVWGERSWTLVGGGGLPVEGEVDREQEPEQERGVRIEGGTSVTGVSCEGRRRVTTTLLRSYRLDKICRREAVGWSFQNLLPEVCLRF